MRGPASSALGGALTAGKGAVAGRLALLTESLCDGRMPEERGAIGPAGRLSGGIVGGGVICAVGASPGGSVFLVAAAGRGGTVGPEAGAIAWEARGEDTVGAAGEVGPATPASAGTWGSGGLSVLIGCWGGRGVSGIYTGADLRGPTDTAGWVCQWRRARSGGGRCRSAFRRRGVVGGTCTEPVGRLAGLPGMGGAPMGTRLVTGLTVPVVRLSGSKNGLTVPLGEIEEPGGSAPVAGRGIV